MIAAFLRTVDGRFDYGALFLSLFLMVVVCYLAYLIYQALKQGYVVVYYYRSPNAKGYIERRKDAPSFWLLIVVKCLMIAGCVFWICVVCFRLWGHGL